MNADYSLCVATPADAASVTSLLEASYPKLMARGYEASDLEPALRVMTKANPALLASGTFYLAVTGAKLAIGCGGWTRERPGTGEVTPGLAHIRHFATHPEWLGRGIGKLIYVRCKKAAAAAGIRRFECYASLNAEAFYAALGFCRLRQIEISMGPSISLPSVLMEAALNLEDQSFSKD